MRKLDYLEPGERYKGSQELFLASTLVAEGAFRGPCCELGGAVRVVFGDFGVRSGVLLGSLLRLRGASPDFDETSML